MRLARIVLAFALLAAIVSIVLTTKPRAAMETEEITARLALGMDVPSLRKACYRAHRRHHRRARCTRR